MGFNYKVGAVGVIIFYFTVYKYLHKALKVSNMYKQCLHL